MRKITFNPNDLGAAGTYGMLASAVAPRPIGFVSTMDNQGNVNLSPFSFFNVFSANPPILIFSPVRSMRTLENKHTLLNAQELPELTINVVNYQMVEQMSLSSTAYDRGVNEFVKAGLTEIASECVRPPYVGESPVSFECKVNQVIETGSVGGSGNLVICEVLRIHVDAECISESGNIDTKKLDLVGRMGESYYVRANGDALFEIPKPIRSKGIGVDALPVHIRESHVLSGNNLGRLGNLEKLPSTEEVNEYVAHHKLPEDIASLHEHAQDHILSGNTWEALLVLMSAG